MAKDNESTHWARQVALLTSIPFALLVGPALGYYGGVWIDSRWESAPWGLGLGLFLGMLAGIRVVVQLIQQANQMEKDV